MIGAIAGQQGFSPDGKTLRIEIMQTDSTTYVTVLSVAGSGVLTSFGAFSGRGGRLKITIDGVVLFTDKLVSVNNEGGFQFGGFIKFNTSLLIESKSDVAGYFVKVMAAALLN